MERESFENEETARILNDYFVCIKVDREERPDLDEIYQQAAQILSGSGGWPLSVFLRPDLKPFYAGTYFPPQDAYNRPGFPRVLLALVKAYHERQDEVDKSSTELAEAIDKNLSHFAAPGSVTWRVIEGATSELERQFDPIYGGFSDVPKFPASMALQLLLREVSRRGPDKLLGMVEKTLDQMSRGGIFDHIGGGFARYSTDRQWLVPHFEKMLYDNALLITVLCEAFQATGRVDFGNTARRTADWVLREMTGSQGGFYSALDADSEGKEGWFYVWTPAQITEVLGEADARLFCRVYNVTESGNFERHTSIPYLAQPLSEWAKLNEFDLQDLQQRLSARREKLLEARQKRVKPNLDDKVIVGWNGLMISALALAARSLSDDVYAQAAAKSAEFILSNIRLEDDLAHMWRDGQSRGAAFQEDYACLTNGLVDLYQADYNVRWLQQAEKLADRMIELFWDDKSGGFFSTTENHETPISRSKSPTDGVTPSGNSEAALALARLGRLTGRQDLADCAQKTIESIGGMAAQAPRAFDNLLVAAHFMLSRPREIVLAGDRSSQDFVAMERILRTNFLPNTVFAFASEGADLPLTEGKSAAGHDAAAFVCSNYTCDLPVYTARELWETLGGSGEPPASA